MGDYHKLTVMKPFFCSIFLLFFCFNSAAAQDMTDLEKQVRTLVQDKEHAKAKVLVAKLLERNPNNVFALFEKARIMFVEVQNEKYRQQEKGFKFTNLQPYLDSLHIAFATAQKAKEVYMALSTDERVELRWKVATTEDEIVRALLHNIENTAYKLILEAPYRKPTSLLYGSGIYNRVTDADEVLALREALLEQCGQFIEQYPQSMYVKMVANYRKELLAEYLRINDLRRYGERDGGMYEKYCASILELYPPEELKHIVPQFYGAEFEIERLYDKSEPYEKLKALAQERSQEVIALLCELNLHYEGYTPEKESLYDRFIRVLAPADIARIAVMKKAAYFVVQKQWAEAAQVHETYRSLFPQWQSFFQKTIELLHDPTPPRLLTNLGAGVNTLAHDYNPVLTADGNTLYFARKNADTGEDIYYAQKVEGVWQPAKKLTQNTSTRAHEVPVNITADASRLIIYGNYSTLPQFNYVNLLERNLGKGDLYYAVRQGDQWGKIQVFPYPINTKHYEAGLAFTADNQAVLFASDRPGGVGGYNPNYPPDKLYYHGAGEFNLDLYVVEKTADGWSEPINLGEVINTPYAEKSPYLHPDMQTLYFSSDGHYGLGGYDIYMTKRLNMNSWTEWSEPVNIGKAVNSPFDDTFYLTATGREALMVSSREGNSFGKRDIYHVEVPKRFQPKQLTLVKGRMTDAEGQGVVTQVRWQTDSEPKEEGTVQTQPDGSFSLMLKNGYQYVFFAEDEMRFGNSGTVDLSEELQTTVVTTPNIALSSTDRNNPNRKPIILKTLHFDHDSDVIRPESYFDLNRLAKLLQERPELSIRIEGHTDSDGDDAFNLDLSKRRAKAVLRYLQGKGVGSQIKGAEGFGELRPIADNTTEEGQQLNRRVEFIVL